MDNSANVSTSAISLQVNGETKTCAFGTPLPDFLEQVGLNPKLVAVEVNGEILTRALWAKTQLRQSDRLEIVTIVGGG